MEYLYHLVDIFFDVYYWLVIVYILMSWFPQMGQTPIGEVLAKVVEPYLYPFRRVIPPIGGMIDISPIVALFALYYIEMGLFTVLDLIGGYI